LVCLTRTIKAHPQKSDLDENFLTFIQSTLAVDLETFKKYLFSDTLANGSALRVAEDIDNACKEADMEASKL
jgi:hypothetical protein